MTVFANPENLQKLEYNVTTTEPGTFRVTIVTGFVAAGAVTSVTAAGALSNAPVSFKVLLDPTLQPGQFRKATAMVALAGRDSGINALGATVRYTIDDAQATWDDESGKTLLLVDATVGVQSPASSAISRFAFQVTTLAKIA
jgi:hypothetical protein